MESKIGYSIGTKGKAVKIFEIELDEKFQGLRVERSEINPIIKRVLKKHPVLNNYSWTLTDSCELDYAVAMTCEGSSDYERLKNKYNEFYFEQYEEMVVETFKEEIQKVLVSLMIENEAKKYCHNTYHPQALRVKTSNSMVDEKKKLLVAKENEIYKLKKEIEGLNKELCELTKPLAIAEIQANPLFSEDEKEQIILRARLK